MGDLKEELKEIKELIQEKDKKKKPKEFKIPFGARVSPSKAKKNWITLMRINENGHVEFKKVQITDQTFIEEGIPRLAGAGYVNYYKKNPIMILPSWSVEPLSPQQMYTDSLNNGSNVKGYKVILAKMKSESINPKKQMGSAVKWIVGLVLAAIVVYALMTGGG